MRRLRWLLVTAAVAPVALYAALAWHGYTRISDLARQSLLQTSRIIQEHAAKVFETNGVLLDRGASVISQAAVERSQDYFAAFYREVSNAQPDLAIALLRADGEVVARYPPVPAGYAPTSKVTGRAFGTGAAEGVIEGRSDLDDTYRIAAFRQVAPYPIYVAVSRTSDGVFDEWRHDLITLALFFVPTSLALVLAISLALKKARSEHDAVVHWHDEIMRRTGAESQLRQLQKYEALGELTGGLAHDFNNLLSIVANNVAVMSLLPRGSDVRPYLTAITRAVANGSGLTKHLLAFARKQPLTFVRIRTADAVPAICDLARHSLPKNVTLKCDVVEGVDDILADRAEIELALINVTVNARDAMPDGGEIVVRVFNVPAGSADTADVPDVAKAYVAISISDTGTGISDAVLHRIFEPFFTTKKDKGTGLGLSRVYGYARQLGGNVTARNNAGGGAVMTLYIPSAGAASEAEPSLEIRIKELSS